MIPNRSRIPRIQKWLIWNPTPNRQSLPCRMSCNTWCRWHSGRSSAAGRALSKMRNIVLRQFCRLCLIRLLTGERKQQSYSARSHVNNLAVEKIMKWCHFSLRRSTEGGYWIAGWALDFKLIIFELWGSWTYLKSYFNVSFYESATICTYYIRILYQWITIAWQLCYLIW